MIAIIASCIPERVELLQRSVVTWKKSIDESDDLGSIYVYLDGFAYKPELPEYVMTSGGPWGRSGSHIKGYNYWYDSVRADCYIFTHPEILFPSETVRAARRVADTGAYCSFKTFWLPPRMTANLDKYPWQTPERLEYFNELFEDDPHEKGHHYINTNIRNIQTWESTTTYAITRETANRLFPLPDFGVQGPDDPYHAALRRHLGIPTATVQHPVLFHQYHAATWDGNQQQAVDLAVQALSYYKERHS